MVDRDEEDQVVEDHQEDVVVDHQDSTPWHATGVGCVATWPVTVPAPRRNHKRWVVVILALPTEDHSNPGKQAQNWTRTWAASPFQRPQRFIR